MRKMLIVSLVMIIGICIFGASKVPSYNVDKYTLMKEIHLVNSVVFNNKDLEKWDQLMVGTVSAETNFGSYKGKSKLGITQVNNAGLGYVKSRLNKEGKQILQIFGYDIKDVTVNKMENDIRLSLIIGSLYYKYKLNNIPPSSAQECAKVWKKYYNTYAGKGTVKGFLAKYKYHGGNTYYAFYSPIHNTILVKNNNQNNNNVAI